MCFGGRPFSFPGPFPGGRGKEKALGMRMGEDMLGGSVTCIFEPWVLQPIVLCDRFLYAMDTQHFILRNYSEWTVSMPYTRIYVFFSDKSLADKERESWLIDQWVSLTEERNAVVVPIPGSGIPGAPPLEG